MKLTLIQNSKSKIEGSKLFLILCAASFLYTFPAYNKYWAPYDEGIILVACQRLLAGEIPYKDFFIIMYPPGQIYILAFLFKIFSSSLIVGRLYTVFVSVGISALVFYMTRFLTRRIGVSLVTWFIALVSSGPRLGTIPAPIWPGVFLALTALYIYIRSAEKLSSAALGFTGMFSGLSILFRHDIGIFVAISILISLFLRLLNNKGASRAIISFLISSLAMVLPCAIYFMAKSATRDIVKSLFLFPFVHQKTAALAFPRPCFDLSMIFHGSLHFINVNQYYIPLLVYLFIIIYLLKRFFKRGPFDNGNLALAPILIFGILTFNLARIRTDPAHLLTVIQPAVILFGFIMHKILSCKFSLKPKTLFKYISLAILAFLFLLLSIKNIDKFVKNCFRKVYRQDIIRTHFAVGCVYLPREEEPDVIETVGFIKNNTRQDERIYIGNIAHWKDDFGGSLILYFLANRLPSTKYYELAPGLVTDSSVQEEIRDSLIRYNVNMVVLQDIDLTDLKRENMAEDRCTLDDYIGENYKLVKRFGKYNIYFRKRYFTKDVVLKM